MIEEFYHVINCATLDELKRMYYASVVYDIDSTPLVLFVRNLLKAKINELSEYGMGM